MKIFKIFLTIVFLMGLFIQPNYVQAQDASDKDEGIAVAISEVNDWITLVGIGADRVFANKSGKEQIKIKGLTWMGPFEIVVNINARKSKGKPGGLACSVDGTIWNWLGVPMICGQNQQHVNTEGLLIWKDTDKMDVLIVEMDWAPCL